MINTSEIDINLARLRIVDLNLNQLLTLVKIYLNVRKEYFDYNIDTNEIEFLKKKQYIMVYEDKNINYFIREKGKLILDQIVSFKYPTEKEVVKAIQRDVIEDFDIKVKQYRSKFNGLKIGSMGSLKDVKSKLKRWMKENPEIDFKTILNATDMYIDSLNGDFNYLQRADYFIYKQNNKKEESSRLSIFIEEGEREPENSDWTSKLT